MSLWTTSASWARLTTELAQFQRTPQPLSTQMQTRFVDISQQLRIRLLTIGANLGRIREQILRSLVQPVRARSLNQVTCNFFRPRQIRLIPRSSAPTLQTRSFYKTDGS